MATSIDSILQSLGLTPSEITVYLAGLNVPFIGVHELSRTTRIKRPTIYHALHALQEKGLVSKKGTARRLVFMMQRPELLRGVLDKRVRSLETQRDALETILPLFAARHASTPGETRVQHVEGVEGINTLIDEALYCKSRRWDILAPKNNFFSGMGHDYKKNFLSTRAARGIKTRTLWERPQSKDAIGRRLAKEEIQERNPRYLPDAFRGRFTSTLILFDETALILSSFDAKQGVLLKSQEIHNLLSMMFDGLWLSSEPYEKIVA